MILNDGEVPCGNTTIEQRILEKFRIGLELALSKHVLDGRVQFLEDWATNSIRVKMRGYLWSEKLGVQEVEWPANWWEHCKQRWFPASWLRRWPVRMTRRRFEARAIYPNYRAVFPNEQVVMAMSRDWSIE